MRFVLGLRVFMFPGLIWMTVSCYWRLPTQYSTPSDPSPTLLPAIPDILIPGHWYIQITISSHWSHKKCMTIPTGEDWSTRLSNIKIFQWWELGRGAHTIPWKELWWHNTDCFCNIVRLYFHGATSQGESWVSKSGHTLKNPGSDLTRKGSHLARPISGSNWHEIWVKNVFLTRIPGQSDLVFWSGLTQKWVWHQGTLSGSNLTLEFLECTRQKGKGTQQ